MKSFSLFSIILVIVLATSYTNAFTRNDFPDDFVFGAATSAYQWEGAVDEDGRTPSIWDTYNHCLNGSTNADIACDGYHKYKEDVKLMAEMGLEAFRLSISWTRIIPNGRGPFNPKGVLFYKNLIKELQSHGIEPHVTLYHYDLPQSLDDEYGGWMNRKIIEDFTTFADICFREFGEDVKLWTTINEATLLAFASYGEGINLGQCITKSTNCSTDNSCTEAYVAGHNMLLAHASVSNLYKLKYKSKQGGSIGLSIYAMGLSPYTNSKDDEIATQRAKAFLYGWMLKPLVFGDYPDEMKETVGSRLPVFSKEESEQVKGSSDFVGIIHYFTLFVTNRPSPPIFPTNTNKDFFKDMGAYMTSTQNFTLPWGNAVPWGLEDILEYVKQSYNNLPVYILENGLKLKQDSPLQDTARVEFIQGFIGAVLNAIKNGSNTKGYFVWSMFDLYELLTGYTQTYGLYYVNFSDPDLKRSPKLSAFWYTGFLNGTIDVASQDTIQLQSNFSGSNSIEDFSAFADVCFREFGDDVELWTTINEATIIFAITSYGEGFKMGH